MSYSLLEIYKRLFSFYGPQHWWPGDSPFEIMVGAILAQNTAWRNVEKAISNLKEGDLLDPKRLYSLDEEELANLIRSAGFYRLKTKRLKNFLAFIHDSYHGEIKGLFSEDSGKLRSKLLKIKGIGEETADSILLYALNKPIFVVDAYTRRIFSRHDVFMINDPYQNIQRKFEESLPRNCKLYNEYHALIVALGKQRCKKEPLCSGCPLQGDTN